MLIHTLKSKKRVRAIQRYLVVDVAESFYTNPSEKRRPEKVGLKCFPALLRSHALIIRFKVLVVPIGA